MLMQVRSGFLMGGKRGPPPPISFFGFSESTNSSGISMPAGILSGDVCYLFDFALSFTTPPSNVTPSGFSAIGTSQTATGGGLGQRWSMWSKTLDGSETTLTGMSGGVGSSKLAMVFRPNPSGTWGAPGSIGNQTTAISGGGGVSSKTVTVGSAPLVVVGAIYTTSGTPTMSPAEDGTAGTGGIQGAYKIYSASPSNVTMSSTDLTSAAAIGAFYATLT